MLFEANQEKISFFYPLQQGVLCWLDRQHSKKSSDSPPSLQAKWQLVAQTMQILHHLTEYFSTGIHSPPKERPIIFVSVRAIFSFLRPKM
jgi:hypothetical protein